MEDDELTRVRREQVGFVFQFFNLLPTLTVADNIALPCLLGRHETGRGRDARQGARRARRHHASAASLPAADLRRRDAARRHRAGADASAARCSSPTSRPGNLDSENGANVLALLESLNNEMGVTILLATHSPPTWRAAAAGLEDARRQVRMRPACRVCRFGASRLFHQFIMRPLAGEKIRTATTIVGVALGIAVVIAIQLTNASSVRGFETALETVAGKTAIEIIGAGTGVDETRLPELGVAARIRRDQPGDRRHRRRWYLGDVRSLIRGGSWKR